jgi:hypothetical protein
MNFLPLRRLRPGLAAVAVGVLLFASGCLQGIGDRCNVDSDCDSGYCALPTGSAQVGGTCQNPNLTDASVADLTPGADLTSTPDM